MDLLQTKLNALSITDLCKIRDAITTIWNINLDLQNTDQRTLYIETVNELITREEKYEHPCRSRT